MATEGFIFSADGKTLLKCDFSKLGTDINVPTGVTKIANGVFAQSPAVSVCLPDTITEIGENLFSSCETLEQVKLPATLSALKPFTFAGCSNLKKITMPQNLSDFPEGLFWGCSSLQEIPFRNGIESLETDVFRDCESITSIVIPPSVKTIKFGALTGCSKLSTIVFPGALETIQDRSLSGLNSLQYMRFSEECKNFFVDENHGCLYQVVANGVILIKCPVNIEKVYLAKNTVDVHIDAFECCNKLAEVYANENAPEELINRLLELVPSIDVNSYSDEPSEEEKFSAKIENLGDNLDQVQVNQDEFSEIGEFTQNDSDEDETSESEQLEIEETQKGAQENQIAQEQTSEEQEISINQEELESILNQNSKSEEQKTTEQTLDNSTQEQEKTQDELIQEILNSQCCRNDSLDEGFRPISMDELENLMNGPVVDPTEQIAQNQEQLKTVQPELSKEIDNQEEKSEQSDQTEFSIQEQETEPTTVKLDELDKTEEFDKQEEIATEEKPKRKRASRKKKTEETQDNAQEEKPERKRASRKKKTEDSSKSSTNVPMQEQEQPPTEEPRFIKAIKKLAQHQMIIEDDSNKIENIYGNLQELFVFADGVPASTNDFSTHLVKFIKTIAKKYGFTKIYFFEGLPLDNPELIYGLETFGNLRNIVYACNKSDTNDISDDQKSLIDAAKIPLLSSKIQSVKDELSDETLQYPIKLIVNDDYNEGLLSRAEKYREDNGINY